MIRDPAHSWLCFYICHGRHGWTGYSDILWQNDIKYKLQTNCSVFPSAMTDSYVLCGTKPHQTDWKAEPPFFTAAKRILKLIRSASSAAYSVWRSVKRKPQNDLRIDPQARILLGTVHGMPSVTQIRITDKKTALSVNHLWTRTKKRITYPSIIRFIMKNWYFNGYPPKTDINGDICGSVLKIFCL